MVNFMALNHLLQYHCSIPKLFTEDHLLCSNQLRMTPCLCLWKKRNGVSACTMMAALHAANFTHHFATKIQWHNTYVWLAFWNLTESCYRWDYTNIHAHKKWRVRLDFINASCQKLVGTNCHPDLIPNMDKTSTTFSFMEEDTLTKLIHIRTLTLDAKRVTLALKVTVSEKNRLPWWFIKEYKVLFVKSMNFLTLSCTCCIVVGEMPRWTYL